MSGKVNDRVGIWVGHGRSLDGSNDSGCVYRYKGKLYTEAELMVPIVNSCVHYLRECGIEVVTDAPTNKINMVKQVSRSNAANVRLHVAFHCDYAKADPGTLPLYVSAKGKKLAEKMNKRVMQYSSLKTRGVGKRTDLYELNQTNMTAVIFEVGSIRYDLKTMLHEFDAIGFGAARGICEYLGVKFDPPQMRLLNALTAIEKGILKNHFTYDGKATYTTFNAALNGKKKVNCALFVTWALQKIGILPTNRRIWLGDGVNGNGAATLKKKCAIYHPNKLWYHCGLHIGDGLGYQWGPSKQNKVHTMVLRGFVNGRPKYATCGSSDIKAKDLSRPRITYDRKKVKTIFRIK